MKMIELSGAAGGAVVQHHHISVLEVVYPVLRRDHLVVDTRRDRRRQCAGDGRYGVMTATGRRIVLVRDRGRWLNMCVRHLGQSLTNRWTIGVWSMPVVVWGRAVGGTA